MEKFILSFSYGDDIKNYELLLNLCNNEDVQLVRVYVYKAKKQIRVYIEVVENEVNIHSIVKKYGINQCDIIKNTERELLDELNRENIITFEMKFNADFYNIYMLKKLCN